MRAPWWCKNIFTRDDSAKKIIFAYQEKDGGAQAIPRHRHLCPLMALSELPQHRHLVEILEQVL